MTTHEADMAGWHEITTPEELRRGERRWKRDETDADRAARWEWNYRKLRALILSWPEQDGMGRVDWLWTNIESMERLEGIEG